MLEIFLATYNAFTESYLYTVSLAGRLGVINISLCLFALMCFLLLKNVFEWHGHDDKRKFRDFFPRKLYFSKSSFLDHFYYFFIAIPLGAVIYGSIMSSLGEVGISAVSFNNSAELDLNKPESSLLKILFLSASLGFLTFFIRDFFTYFTHRLMHSNKILWKFHKVHHSALVLFPATGFRMHLFEKFFDAFAMGLGHAFSVIIFFNLFLTGVSTPEATLIRSLGFIIFTVVYMPIMTLRHFHIRVSFGPFFNKIFVSPAYHHLHHAREQEFHDRNFANVFPVFDLIFGTYLEPKKHYNYQIGTEDSHEYNTVKDLFIRPFIEIRQEAKSKERKSEKTV